jgi:hypothetical protein
MGASYERYLIAKGNAFSPSAVAVAKLVERLRKEHWIADPKAPEYSKLRFSGARAKLGSKAGGYAVTTVDNDFGDDVGAKVEASTEALPLVVTAEWLDDSDREELRLVWPVESNDSPLKYPLSRRPGGPAAYALELHRAHDYVSPVREGIAPVPTRCLCGEDLGFHWDEDEVVPTFGASSGIFAECEACSRTFDPSKGTASLVNPLDGTRAEVRGGATYRFALKVDCGKSFVADGGLVFAPELVALLEEEFGREFYEVGATYRDSAMAP